MWNWMKKSKSCANCQLLQERLKAMEAELVLVMKERNTAEEELGRVVDTREAMREQLEEMRAEWYDAIRERNDHAEKERIMEDKLSDVEESLQDLEAWVRECPIDV